MLKYLVAPSFKFITDLIGSLPAPDKDEKYGRILTYPITNGLRFRNMDCTLSVEFEVSGGIVTAVWVETVSYKAMNVPYTKCQTFAITDVAAIAENIAQFFERKWEIEKDV